MITKTAALLERAYRMALVLQGRIGAGEVETGHGQTGAFEQFVISNELVSILDEARFSLFVQVRATTGSEN